LRILGRIDVLVNNAGATQVMPFALIEEEDWDEIIAGNLKTLFLVTREAARDMVARRSGCIINLGSIAGHRLLEVPVHYATAKAGVSGFTTALAAELKRYAIRVNEVVPGLLEAGVSLNVPDKERDDYLRHCAAGRPGKLEEVAELVFFLASDRAAYINAQSLFIDGGL
jgi:3-oxoacyl-[acyl-carrier protein] reductase